MAFPWLLRSWLQNAARRKVQETVMNAAREQLARGADSNPDTGSESTPARQHLRCDVGLIFALPDEQGCLEDRLDGVVQVQGDGFVAREAALRGRGVVIVQSGAGPQAAARGTQALIDGHHPAWVVAAGFASALQGELKQGHLLMADHLTDGHGRELTIDLKVPPEALAAMPDVHVGPLLHVDRMPRSPQEKKNLGREHRALACDMESLAVADVCRRNKTRFLAVRVIREALEDETPRDVERLSQQKTAAARVGAVVGAVFRRPSSIKDMARLKESGLEAADKLAKFLEGVILQLAPKQGDRPNDAGQADAGPSDAGPSDAGPIDASPTDEGKAKE